MKKSLIMTLVLVFVLGIGCTAFAGPFADVPAKHWAYDAVSKLAQAGIVDGYGDGTFRGDKTMTRYEMAQIVGKAMERSDKADAENKALIKKLADEFAQELDSLGVRVTKLENKVGNITWTGQVREWYQWQDQGTGDRTGLDTRILLWATAPLTKDITFVGRFSSWSGWGDRTMDDDGDLVGRVGSTVEMDNAYLQGKNWTLGRQPITLGKGLVYNAGYNNDGVTFTFGEQVKFTGMAFKNILGENMLAANVAYQATDNLDLTAVYAKNREGDFGLDMVDTWALGFGYKGLKNVTVTGEFGQNNADIAKIENAMWGDGFKAPSAWTIQAKYKGAEWKKTHTWGFWVGYRDAEPGFNALTGDPLWETHLGVLGSMDNVKGAEVGFDYTVFNNAVFTFNYLDLESNDFWEDDLKGLTAQLRYFF